MFMTRHFNRTEEKALRRQLRQDQTYCEEIVWMYLRNRKTHGCKFRRQYSIDKYVVDFYCPLLRLAIEIDGCVHDAPENKLNDITRQHYIEQYGIEFLRITNDELMGNSNKAFKRIEERILQLTSAQR